MCLSPESYLVVYLSKTEYDTLDVVPHVELSKYLGKWYEIAHLPAKFQEGCNETTATYTLLDKGAISVLNECKKKRQSETGKGKSKSC